MPVGDMQENQNKIPSCTYPVKEPKSAIKTPSVIPITGGTAAPGIGFLGEVRAKMTNTRTAVPNPSMKNAWNGFGMSIEFRLWHHNQSVWNAVLQELDRFLEKTCITTHPQQYLPSRSPKHTCSSHQTRQHFGLTVAFPSPMFFFIMLNRTMKQKQIHGPGNQGPHQLRAHIG
jgi:hypothetical protein